jgi:hypothetical protein
MVHVGRIYVLRGREEGDEIKVNVYKEKDMKGGEQSAQKLCTHLLIND